MNATRALSIENLTKRFGAVQALRGVSFTVEPGEVFGYLGPNGAGKTTTLRIVVGLVHATSGSVHLFGVSNTNPLSRVPLGFLPGDLALYGDLRGQALLDYFARFRPEHPPTLRAELIERLGLDEGVLQRRVKFLSHGTRQKLGLIIAMQHDPALLLLDEPSNGLDPLVQQAFRETVRDFARRGRAVLFSSHVLSEVEVICERVAILRAGQIVALETIEQLRANVVRRLRVRFDKDVPASILQLEAVTRSETSGNTATLWVKGNLNPLLRALADASVQDFVFPEPELEDIFLAYYREEQRSNA